MELLIILFVMIVYVLLSIAFIRYVQRRTTNQTYRRLALAFAILLPIWDVLLGIIVYYPACLIIPKSAIYETAETESIYYEGLHDYVFMLERRYRNTSDEELTQIGSIYYVIRRGYSFVEAKIVEKRTVTPSTKERIKPAIYKCVPLPKDDNRPDFQRTSCSVVSEVTSRYMVKVTTVKLGITDLCFKKILDRNTGKLMAENNRVTLWSYYGFLWIPFFNWLDWGRGLAELHSKHCPPNTEYESLELKVLKPKK